jgi:hypothetical protein
MNFIKIFIKYALVQLLETNYRLKLENYRADGLEEQN